MFIFSLLSFFWPIFATIPFLPTSDNRNRRIIAAYFTIGLLILPIVYFVLTKDMAK